MQRTLKKSLWLIAGLVVIGALLYRARGSAMLAGFSWQKLGASLKDANFGLLALALATIFVSYAIRAVRWKRFSRYMGKAHFWNVYSATIMGFTAVFLLGRAGEPVRPLLIARKDRLPVGDSLGVYVLERIFDAGATVVLAACALLLIPRGSLSGPSAGAGQQSSALLRDARLAGWALFGGLVILIALLVYFRLHGARALQSRLRHWHTRGGWRGRIATLAGGFSEGLQAIRSAGDLFAAISYTVIHWAVVALVYFWVIRSFGRSGGHLEFRGAMLVLAFTMVGSVVQLPTVGGGMQLSTFLVLSVIFGVEKEPAAAIAIMIWIVTFAAVTIVGLPLLIREGWSMGTLRRLVREENADEERGRHASLAEIDMAKQTRETRR
ncbi:MAG: lysylphosphatidylglycerol synthase transmembrane domain-containing protein [Candidatus Acidiferrales bacterium]